MANKNEQQQPIKPENASKSGQKRSRQERRAAKDEAAKLISRRNFIFKGLGATAFIGAAIGGGLLFHEASEYLNGYKKDAFLESNFGPEDIRSLSSIASQIFLEMFVKDLDATDIQHINSIPGSISVLSVNEFRQVAIEHGERPDQDFSIFPAFTTDDGFIFVNMDSLQHVFDSYRYLHTSEFDRVRAYFVLFTLLHEYTHSVSIEEEFVDADAEKIKTTLMGLLAGDESSRAVLAQVDSTTFTFQGAKILFDLNEQEVSFFVNVEEYEADIIGGRVVTQRMNTDNHRMPDTVYSDDQNFQLYRTLLGLLNDENHYHVLVKARTTPNGRIDWFRYLGEKLAPAGKDPVEFGMSVLWAIEQKNEALFTQLLSHLRDRPRN